MKDDILRSKSGNERSSGWQGIKIYCPMKRLGEEWKMLGNKSVPDTEVGLDARQMTTVARQDAKKAETEQKPNGVRAKYTLL